MRYIYLPNTVGYLFIKMSVLLSHQFCKISRCLFSNNHLPPKSILKKKYIPNRGSSRIYQTHLQNCANTKVATSTILPQNGSIVYATASDRAGDVNVCTI